MTRERRLLRLFRALSGDTQEEVAEMVGASRSLVGAMETGDVEVDPKFLEPMAERAEISVTDGDLLLHSYDTMRRVRERWGLLPAEQIDGLLERLRLQIEAAYRRFLTLPLPESLPRPGDRERAEVLFERLAAEPREARPSIVRAVEQFRSWAVCERVCAAAVAAGDVGDEEEAAAWASLAGEIAGQARGTEEFRTRLAGYAAAHEAGVLRAAGDLQAADAAFAEAERLWRAGADPYGVLDARRLQELETALRRDQRWPAEALAAVEQAWAPEPRPEHVLLKQGLALEAAGDYEGAEGALRETLPLSESEPRLLSTAKVHLAGLAVHLGRHREAKGFLKGLRETAAELEDELLASRVTWLEGRIAAGLGRRHEALLLLGEARRDFERRKMTYDAALARLEEAALLLEEGRATEVKAPAAELVRVFEASGVHREALAALRLFHEAAQREKATAEMARRVLRFLFRARHDEEARFEE